MFELKNNSESTIHFRRPDLRLNFDLAPGQAYTVTARQAFALDLFIRDMDISVSPVGAGEPSPETQSTEIDKEAAVRGVAMSGVIAFNSESRRPENVNDFYTGGRTDDDLSDSAKAEKVKDLMSKSAKHKAEAEELKGKIKDEDLVKEIDDGAEKAEKDAKKSVKDGPKTNQKMDLGELVPMAGGPEKDTSQPKSDATKDLNKEPSKDNSKDSTGAPKK